MIAIFNKFRIGLVPIYVMLAILTASVTLVSCSKDENNVVDKQAQVTDKQLQLSKQELL